ncbi:TPA: hypothetical protein RJN57_000480 [Pseudomonas aeruginosa]|nr:hypothetical protein [Pseudomonas aeruginosa]HDV6122976.1 hypothetical protein [Pseudomonas aeruginosa]HDV6143854.1 hypothetical protein [Pseudomonas aeruginosa]HDV6168498.1 hypothetical protein [Pseudomonas aeruginosa]
MSTSTHLTRSYIHRIEKLMFASYIDVSGMGDYRLVEFEKTIFWIREASAKVNWLMKGRIFKSGPEHSDYYGFMTSLQNAVDTAKDLLAEHGGDLGSDMSIAVDLVVTDTPAVLDLSPQGLDHTAFSHNQVAYQPIGQFSKPNWGYADDPNLKLWAQASGDERFELSENVRWVRPMMVVEMPRLWDSSKGVAESDQAVADFIASQPRPDTSMIGQLIGQVNDFRAKVADMRAAARA